MQLTIVINFISFLMHSKSANIEIVINDKADEVIKDFFNHFYQVRLKISISGSDFIFYSLHLLCYKSDLKSFKPDVTHIDYPDWIQNEIATINPINKKDDKCFQYAATVALILIMLGFFRVVFSEGEINLTLLQISKRNNLISI